MKLKELVEIAETMRENGISIDEVEIELRVFGVDDGGWQLTDRDLRVTDVTGRKIYLSGEGM